MNISYLIVPRVWCVDYSPIQHSSRAQGEVLTTSGGSTPTFRHNTSATLTVFICGHTQHSIYHSKLKPPKIISFVVFGCIIWLLLVAMFKHQRVGQTQDLFSLLHISPTGVNIRVPITFKLILLYWRLVFIITAKKGWNLKKIQTGVTISLEYNPRWRPPSIQIQEESRENGRGHCLLLIQKLGESFWLTNKVDKATWSSSSANYTPN